MFGVVVTVTVAVAEDVPFRVSVLGETLHEEAGGAPLQVKVTLWLKPPLGLIVIV